MGLGKALAKAALIGTVIAMARSRNAVTRGIGRATGFIAAPRLTRFVGRRAD